MYFATNQFPELLFCGPHKKPRGVRGLSKNYHMCFDPKISHNTCSIFRIPCVCNQRKSTIYKTCTPGTKEHQQPLYQPVNYFP